MLLEDCSVSLGNSRLWVFSHHCSETINPNIGVLPQEISEGKGNGDSDKMHSVLLGFVREILTIPE